ncbi:MAG: hypothetical protein DPW11_00620 [bacterium]|nr:hypothetical protein [bacterium]RIK52036.1 MAG: hypothetical protein DCC61_00495 [Candidatus Microgenomates bacterium]
MSKEFLHRLMENITSALVGLFAIGIGVFVIYSLQISFEKPLIPKPSSSINSEAPIVVPNLTTQGISDNKDQDNLFLQTDRWNVANILANPISTPPFVTNPDKLRNYLEGSSVEINVEGNLDKAYLYLSTGPIDINRESVYFFIVDGYSKQGHLVASESPVNGQSGLGRTEFLFDLSKLPLSSLPFPLEDHKEYVDVLSDFLNRDIDYKSAGKKRQYFVGGFVSTTRLPNQITKMQIRYQCEIGQSCKIIVTP